MKKLTIILGLLFAFGNMQAQEYNIDKFNEERIKISRTGLYSLAGWSAANFIVSGIGWGTTEGATQYFHRANVTWNFVNAAIAVPGLISSYKKSSSGLSLYSTYKEQRKTEAAYLINGIFDASYIGIGLFLRERSKNIDKNQDITKGWGNALLLQGSFLLLTDIVMYSWHSAHASKNFKKIDHSFSFYGTGFNYSMRFN